MLEVGNSEGLGPQFASCRDQSVLDSSDYHGFDRNWDSGYPKNKASVHRVVTGPKKSTVVCRVTKLHWFPG
jgi:hypothetical protein